jgi:hypothetical protein
MERFSCAYVGAIAAVAACTFDEVSVDEDGIDVTLCRRGTHKKSESPSIAIQLKSTTQWGDEDDHITYPLKVKNYERLRARNRTIPAILAVLPMPSKPDEWIVYEDQRIALHHRAYWIDLTGAGPTPNKTTITISIPKNQLLDELAIVDLMNRVTPGGLSS